MVSTDAQVRRLMEEMSRYGEIGKASMRAGMDRKTGRKYMKLGKLPSDLKKDRTWETREDPFAEDWPWIEAMLEDAPELEAKSLFEYLLECRPGKYEPGQLRTFQRRVRKWRATKGPDKRIFFAQEHRPGEAAQTDFTSGNKLGITICGDPFDHLLCHVVLPHSNWEWATVCWSESMAALRRGVQEGVFRLGRVPVWHQTDNSSAATHNLTSGKRAFNEEYASLMKHLGMKPRTTGVGEKEQNGDVEALNGAMKRRLQQHLLLRGSRDFVSVEEYEQWVQQVLVKANQPRQKKLREELAVMRPLQVRRLPEYREDRTTVSKYGTIRVGENTYSVPSRLRKEKVRVRIFDNRLEVYHGTDLQLVVERLQGRNGHRINYRHVIASLVRHPGAFARYKYREDMFPSLMFRQAYDALCEALPERGADLEYLRILHLAARTMETDVEVALELLAEEGVVPSSNAVKDLVAPRTAEIPQMSRLVVDLSEYDALLRHNLKESA